MDSQIILRNTKENTKDLELFIGNHDAGRVYVISITKQVAWLFLLLRNIIKHIKLDHDV